MSQFIYVLRTASSNSDIVITGWDLNRNPRLFIAFDYYDQGTTLTPTLKTVDVIMQCQAQRGILEFTFADHEPGLYMFHAHQSEFTELGWMGMFDVVEAVS